MTFRIHWNLSLFFALKIQEIERIYVSRSSYEFGNKKGLDQLASNAIIYCLRTHHKYTRYKIR
jgi:hypothetical protein